MQEILASASQNDIPQLEIQPHVLEHLIDGYETAIHETKNSISNEINSKVKKSIELKRAAKPKSRKRKRQDNNVNSNENKPL